jgi:hypothetical protein
MTTGEGPVLSTRPHRATAAWEAALRAIGRRWPTLLAAAVAAVTLWDSTGGSEFVTVLLIAAVGYQAMALTTRRSWTWPLVLVLLAAVAGLRAAGIAADVVLGAAVGVLAVVGLALRLRGLRALQIPVALVLTGLAVLALRVPPAAAAILVAAGLIGHAVWDLVQWRADAVIARSFAEWCGVFDLVLGVGLLLVVAL